ncbi:MAG: DNA repair protein RecN [Chloroflexota bacterium]|nr:MAG: DNA repair protein RecN [Chloroflexota bacterium]
MLTELHIRNFAIIDELVLEFGPGLNILTGETGAGKSIIIDAVGLLLGDRAAVEWVRAGAEMAQIEATFLLPADPERAAEVSSLLESEGLDDPDNPQWVVLNREVRLNGRNVCRINGRSVSLQLLADVAGLLVDVHGQGEHLGLLRPRTHIHLLDRYGGLMAQRTQIANLVAELRRVRSELQRLRQDARTMAQRLDLLSFQVEEITAAQLRPGEDNELEAERRRLGNAEALTSLAQTAYGILNQGDGEVPGAIDMVSEAVGRLEKLARIDPDMAQHADEGQALIEQLSDLARALQDYAESLEFNPERLAEVEERLELIANLKRKYGDTIEQIVAYGAKAQRELEELGNWEAKTTDLEAQEEKLLRQVGALSAQLSARRKAAGEAMAREVERELADLKMVRARFGVAIEQSERSDGAYLPDGRRVAFDSTGVDQVEFLISANPGEPLKPMARVASGGETARLMLALKSTLAHADATPTLIFDEIDQGIGGRVGAIVGQKLWRLTGSSANANGAAPTTHQVLCITHLPQLAAFGDRHFTVSKQLLDEGGVERTHTVVRALHDEDRIHELMLMLGAHSDAGRRSVEEMLGEVTQVKQGAFALQ